MRAMTIAVAGLLAGCSSHYACDRQAIDYARQGKAAPCLEEIATRGLTEEQKRLRLMDARACALPDSQCELPSRATITIEEGSDSQPRSYTIKWR